MANIEAADTGNTAKKPAPVSATNPAPLPPALAALQNALPPAVLSRVQAYFTNPNLSSTDAATYALQFIRTTPWYAQTYPGIQEGISNGLFTDETGYRAHLNQLNQLYQQYTGQSATPAQVTHSLTQGFTLGRIANGFQGNAYITANKNEIQATLGAFDQQGPLTQPQLQALGKEQAGIDSPMGQILQRRLQLAQQRLQGAFKGTLANPSLSFTSGRLAGITASQPSDTAA